MGRRYRQQYDGDTIRPFHNGYRMRCCDCGLVHKINFRVYTEAKHGAPSVKMRVWRDVRATAATRSWLKRLRKGIYAGR